MPIVTLRLSVAEARALDRAAGNTTCHPDALEAVFPHPASRAAALRACEKLQRQIYSAGGYGPKSNTDEETR